MTRKITTERCMCGHASCKDTWLVGIGKFVQGSGFTPEEAERIVKALNGPTSAAELTEIIRGWLDKDDASHFGEFERGLARLIGDET